MRYSNGDDHDRRDGKEHMRAALALRAARTIARILGWLVRRTGPDGRAYLQAAGIDVDGFTRQDRDSGLHAAPSATADAGPSASGTGGHASRSAA